MVSSDTRDPQFESHRFSEKVKKVKLVKNDNKKGRGGGQVVSVLDFYGPSLNPAEFYLPQ